MRVVILLALVSIFATPLIAGATSTPEATPLLEIDCFELEEYYEDVYLRFDPDLTFSEYAIVEAAWTGGSEAWERMSASELYLAASFYDAWGRDLRSTKTSEIPAGLEEYHELLTRNVELMGMKVQAFIDDDRPKLRDAADESFEGWERMYEIELEGVSQCGSGWVDVFGEPWDPNADATPVATLQG